jgi:hypothetical protein
MIRHGQDVKIHDASDAHSFGPLEENTGAEQANAAGIT